MAVKGKQVTVPATAGGIRLDTADVGAERIVVRNKGATSVFLGGPSVAASGGSAGFELEADKDVTLDLNERDEIRAIVASGTKVVMVLEQGV